MASTGNRIQTRREHLGISRQELAEQLGTTRMTIYRVETGTVQIPADELPKWAKALKTKARELVA